MRTHWSWVARFIVLGNATVSVAITLLHPTSQHGRALQDAGFTGALAFATIVACVLVGYIDLLLNDVPPKHVDWPWSHKYRHLGFMLLGAGQLGWFLEALQLNDPDPIYVWYVWNMLCSFGLAGMGVWQHVRDIRRHIITENERDRRMHLMHADERKHARGMAGGQP